MIKHWKTTVLGICAGLPDLVLGILSKDLVQITKALCIMGMGIVAKDSSEPETTEVQNFVENGTPFEPKTPKSDFYKNKYGL